MADPPKQAGGGKGSPDGTDDDALSARLKSLDQKLDQAVAQREARRSAASGDRSTAPSQLGQAFRLSSEFIAGVIGGALLGWAFDWLVGSRPWGLIVFLMLGFAAGIYNVARSSGTRP